MAHSGGTHEVRAEHIVPLATQAVAVLKELQPLTGRHQLVFPGQSNLRKPMSENTMLYAMYRIGYHRQVTVHETRVASRRTR